MKTIVILQARMGSTRLPNKVMADLAGEPLLARVIQRAQAISGVDQVVVATTTAERDRPLLDLARRYGADALAGSEDDVLDRYTQTARAFGAQVIVRVTGDCPLLDPQVSGRVLARFCQGDVDYASNTLTPTFPDGLDTEVFSRAALERAWREAQLTSEREHVTPYIWKNPDKFRLANVTNDVNLFGWRWTVDEPADLEFVRAVYSHFETPQFGMQDILNLLREHPELSDINAGFARNEGYEKSLRADQVIKKEEAR